MEKVGMNIVVFVGRWMCYFYVLHIAGYVVICGTLIVICV